MELLQQVGLNQNVNGQSSLHSKRSEDENTVAHNNAPQIEYSELVWFDTSCLGPQKHSNKVSTISNEDYKFFEKPWKTFSKNLILSLKNYKEW